MSDHIDKTIAELQLTLARQEQEVIKTKQLINLLCGHAGRQPIYASADLESDSNTVAIASDEFYGQPLATAMRKILEKRKASGNGPATPRELYTSLLEGGYAFDTDVEENRLIGIRVSLRKSTKIFHRLPDGKRYGLLEWYPKAKRQSDKTLNGNSDEGDEKDSAASKVIDLDDFEIEIDGEDEIVLK